MLKRSLTKTFVPRFADKKVKSAALEKEALQFSFWAVVWEITLLVLYAVFTDYVDPRAGAADVAMYYNYMRDVSVMIFFGFAYLMTFLRRAGLSAIGYTFFISALVVQWSVLLQIVATESFPFAHRHGIGVFSLLNGLFCAAAVMITYGGVLGKVTPLQLLILGIIQPMFYWLNVWISTVKLHAIDVGGGMVIHLFGAYFGMTLTWFTTSPLTVEHPDNATNYTSDLFSLAGTIFLWIMWPSFNAATAALGIEQSRAILNTFLSLTGATIATFIASRVVSHWKFEPVHIQNSTLAGGVAMGVVANLAIHPATAIGVGFVSGIVSVLGFTYLTPWLTKRCNLQDICGIHNLHGMPGFLSAFVGIFATLALSRQNSANFYHGTTQPLYQFLAMIISFALSVAGGLLVGFLWMVCYKGIYKMWAEDDYNDRPFWAVATDYFSVVRKDPKEMERYFQSRKIPHEIDEDGMHGESTQSDPPPLGESPREVPLQPLNPTV